MTYVFVVTVDYDGAGQGQVVWAGLDFAQALDFASYVEGGETVTLSHHQGSRLIQKWQRPGYSKRPNSVVYEHLEWNDKEWPALVPVGTVTKFLLSSS